MLFSFACSKEECECNRFVSYYNAFGNLEDVTSSTYQGECGKYENYTESDGGGTKEVTIICDSE